jgi:hypothetical protein
MSKLELPADVADKVFGMLKPKARPFGVFIFHREPRTTDCDFTIKIKAEALTSDEMLQLEETSYNYGVTISDGIGGRFAQRYLRNACGLDDYVHSALSMEFNFRTEVDRQRWQDRESFEMYRAAVRAIV